MKTTTTHSLTAYGTSIRSEELAAWLADKSGTVTVSVDHGDRPGEVGALRFTITEESR